MIALRRIKARLRDEAGFTMIVAIGVMFVTSLILAAAFTIANNEVATTRTDATQKASYLAALSGIQEYEARLQSEPNFWETCESLSKEVPQAKEIQKADPERYETAVLPANGAEKCLATSPFSTAIESSGTQANTFRVEATGYAGKEKRQMVATFKVTGFLDFIYFTNFETLDPTLYSEGKKCAGKYYHQWHVEEELNCQEIEFTTGDHIEGPMHTNDATDVGGSATFGREGHSPADEVQINGGTYPKSGCGAGVTAVYYTATKCYETGEQLEPPESDTSLEAYVEAANEYEGAVYLTLNGAANTITVTKYNSSGTQVSETVKWPTNGLIYVKPSSTLACTYEYESESSDTSTEVEQEKGCGTVYVKGTYSKSLTVAGSENLVINGSVYPTSVEGKLGSAPTGTAVLGLIATDFIRIYHPCSGGKNGAGSLENPWIYAGVLSTQHSWIVDNYSCGAELGKLHEYGAIGQDYRGPVGTGGRFGNTGYLKDYKYDDRLATDEPPYFLQPLRAGWKIIRETAPGPG